MSERDDVTALRADGPFFDWTEEAARRWLAENRRLTAIETDNICRALLDYSKRLRAAATREAADERTLAIEEAMRDRIIEKAGLAADDCDVDSTDPADHVSGGIEAMRRSLDVTFGQLLDREATRPVVGEAVAKLRDLGHRMRGIRYASYSQEIDAIAERLKALPIGPERGR